MLEVLLALVPASVGAPRDDPTVLLAEHDARVRGVDAFLGAPDRGPAALSTRFGLGAESSPPVWLQGWRAESTPGTWATPSIRVRPVALGSVGALAPSTHGGDTEPGLGSARGGADMVAYAGVFELSLRPQLALDVAPTALGLGLRDAWLGLRAPVGSGGRIEAGAGLRDRWIGPGRRGSLMLTDNARPAPAGSLAWDGRAGGWRWAHLRLEAGAGWLDGERGDVQNPGWLFMDLRWLPATWIELGASRVAIFGGEGRPPPTVGQLLLPVEPHIYDDPDAVLPDTDELAALDLRLTVPLSHGFDYIEGYWQYGGEDLVMNRTLGLRLPSLAGVANLYGAELSAGAWTWNVEGARILDDRFRWYTGHRVYHEGFTRDGLCMAHPAGGDAFDLWGALTWLGALHGAELSAGRTRRVGIIDTEGDNLLALSEEEHRIRVGLRGWRARQSGGWWIGGAQVERASGIDFVPGADGWSWRLSLELR